MTATTEVKKTTDGGGAIAAYDYGQSAGAGFEGTDSSHFTIPFLTLLEAKSKPVEDGLEGAKAGYLFNTVTQQCIPGDEGVVFVPCYATHQFVEWVPRKRGGGFVGVHEPNSAEVLESKDASETFGKYTIGNTDEDGNEVVNDLVETFSLYGLILNDKDDAFTSDMAIISFTSMRIKPYRQIMYRLHQFKGSAPLFAHRLVVKTVKQSKGGDTFFNFDIKPVNGDISSSLIPPATDDGKPHPVLKAGESLLKAVTSGQAQAAYDSTSADSDGSGEDANPF